MIPHIRKKKKNNSKGAIPCHMSIGWFSKYVIIDYVALLAGGRYYNNIMGVQLQSCRTSTRVPVYH